MHELEKICTLCTIADNMIQTVPSYIDITTQFLFFSNKPVNEDLLRK